RARRRPQTDLRCAARERACLGPACGGAMIAAVGTVAGVFLVDVEAEELLGEGNEVPATEKPEVALPRVVAAARSGATVVAVRERLESRDPLLLVRAVLPDHPPDDRVA